MSDRERDAQQADYRLVDLLAANEDPDPRGVPSEYPSERPVAPHAVRALARIAVTRRDLAHALSAVTGLVQRLEEQQQKDGAELIEAFRRLTIVEANTEGVPDKLGQLRAQLQRLEERVQEVEQDAPGRRQRATEIGGLLDDISRKLDVPAAEVETFVSPNRGIRAPKRDSEQQTRIAGEKYERLVGELTASWKGEPLPEQPSPPDRSAPSEEMVERAAKWLQPYYWRAGRVPDDDEGSFDADARSLLSALFSPAAPVETRDE